MVDQERVWKLSTTISARPTPPMLSPSPTFESLQIIVLIRKSQMLMEDSQCLVYKAIGMLLLILMSSQISGSMVMPAKFGVQSWIKKERPF